MPCMTLACLWRCRSRWDARRFSQPIAVAIGKESNAADRSRLRCHRPQGVVQDIPCGLNSPRCHAGARGTMAEACKKHTTPMLDIAQSACPRRGAHGGRCRGSWPPSGATGWLEWHACKVRKSRCADEKAGTSAMPFVLGIEAEASAAAGAMHPWDAAFCHVPARVRIC